MREDSDISQLKSNYYSQHLRGESVDAFHSLYDLFEQYEDDNDLARMIVVVGISGFLISSNVDEKARILNQLLDVMMLAYPISFSKPDAALRAKDWKNTYPDKAVAAVTALEDLLKVHRLIEALATHASDEGLRENSLCFCGGIIDILRMLGNQYDKTTDPSVLQALVKYDQPNAGRAFTAYQAQRGPESDRFEAGPYLQIASYAIGRSESEIVKVIEALKYLVETVRFSWNERDFSLFKLGVKKLVENFSPTLKDSRFMSKTEQGAAKILADNTNRINELITQAFIGLVDSRSNKTKVLPLRGKAVRSI